MLCLRLRMWRMWRMRRMCGLGMGLLGLLGLLRVCCLSVYCLSMCCIGSRHLAIGPVRSWNILHVHLAILRHHLVNHLCLAGPGLKKKVTAWTGKGSFGAKGKTNSYIPKKVFNTTEAVVLLALHDAHVSPLVI